MPADENPDQPAYRSAATNTALGIAAASPFLAPTTAWALNKIGQGKQDSPEPPPPKIELPPGADRK